MRQNTENIIREFIEGIGMSVTFTSDEKNGEESMLWCAVSTPESRFFTARDGEALNALNHIVRRVVEKRLDHNGDEDRLPSFVIDISNFKKKKIENLRTLAHMIAERARFFKSSIDVDPMPAFDRRIVHEFLSHLPDIETLSSGEGKARHVVVKYIEPKKDSF